MAGLSGWLRHHSEEELVAAAQHDLARRYLDRDGPLRADEGGRLFWQGLFVPVYRRLPWGFRRFVLGRLPGSHRRRWRKKPPP